MNDYVIYKNNKMVVYYKIKGKNVKYLGRPMLDRLSIIFKNIILRLGDFQVIRLNSVSRNDSYISYLRDLESKEKEETIKTLIQEKINTMESLNKEYMRVNEECYLIVSLKLPQGKSGKSGISEESATLVKEIENQLIEEFSKSNDKAMVKRLKKDEIINLLYMMFNNGLYFNQKIMFNGKVVTS